MNSTFETVKRAMDSFTGDYTLICDYSFYKKLTKIPRKLKKKLKNKMSKLQAINRNTL